MSTSANGYSVGNLATMTISGTVPYKYGTYQRNAQINLYEQFRNSQGQETSRVLMFTWFLKDCTIYNESSITFTGIDAMAYTNNNYSITTGDTVGTQFTTAIGVISALTNATITIDRPVISAVSSTVYDKQSSNSIKSLMEETAKLDCGNYYTECHSSYIELKKQYGVQVQVSDTDIYEPLSLGVAQTPINMVRLYQTDMELPVPKTGETLEDYGIFTVTVGSQQPTLASTMKIVSPLMGPDIDTSRYSQAFNGKTFGTQFSCKKILLSTTILSGAYFFTPLSQIIFGSDYSKEYYICSADYSLTSEGVVAGISGTAKSISDYEYIGETEKSLRQKLELQHNYHGSYFSISDGLIFDEYDGTVTVNSG